MFKQTPKKRVLFVRRLTPVLLAFFGVFSLVVLNLHSPKIATAATASTINFQARLQTAAGGIVPDGNYNVEFKLYAASGTGTALWTEDYLNTASNGLKTVNGYLTANLGSVTAFSGINWDQPLWMTMNIGGTSTTGTPSWDGEMNPRLPLTAVPYAFAAGQLATTSGSNRSNLTIQAPTGGNQNFVIQDQGAAGTYNLLTTATANLNYIQLQSSSPGSAQTGNFNISGTGMVGNLLTAGLDSVSGGTINIGVDNAAAINLGATSYNSTLTVGSVQTGSVTYLQGGDSGINLTTSGIAMNADGYTIKVAGTTALSIDSSRNLTTAYTITAGNLQSSSLDTASAGTLSIGNGNATTANLATNNAAHTVNIGTGVGIETISIGSTSSVSSTLIQGGGNGIGFNTDNSGWYNFGLGGTNVFSINGGSGAAVFQTLSNQSGAFQIQGSGGTVFSVDTSANQVQTGTSSSLLVGTGGITTTGALSFSGTTMTSYVTPLGTSIGTKINIPNVDPGGFSQIIALGLPVTAQSTSRAITILDARNVAHQPSIAVLSPDENQIGGLSWDGSNTNFLVKASSASISLQNSVGLGLMVTGSGSNQLTQLGQAGVANGQLQFSNSTNLFSAALQAPSVSANYVTNLPTAIGTAGQCLTVASVASTTQTLGYGSCGGVSPTLQNVYDNSSSPATIALSSGKNVTIKDYSTTVGNIFQIQNSAASTTYFAVTSSAATAATFNATSGFSANGTAGASTTCSGGQFLQNQIVSEGIVTGGTCATPTDTGVTTVGTIDGGTYSANGGAISGTTLFLQTASGTHVGLVNIGAQTFAGNKTFTGNTLVKNTSTTALQVQDASSNILFTADTSTGTITFGTGSNTVIFTASGGLVASGTAQHAKTINLTAEYAGAVLDAASDSSCSSANNGTMTSGYDNTNYQNYYKWASAATAQCYDVVVRVTLPSDFNGWSSSTPLSLKSYTANTSTGTINVDARDTSNTAVTGCAYAAATPASATTWTAMGGSCNLSSGTYAANGTMTLRIRMTGGASSDVRIGDIALSYNSKF